MSDKPKIYGFLAGGSNDWWHVSALSEDGDFLAEHICSSEVYFRMDLGFDKSTRKHDAYDAAYPKGWELVWVDEPTKDPRVMAAYQKHLDKNWPSDKVPV